jgi:hypothetical protein
MTRCKPGDLAVVVGAQFSLMNIGRLVIVEAPFNGGFVDGYHYGSRGDGDWIIRAVGSPLVVVGYDGVASKTTRHVANDRFLRPIRPGEGEDETLSWLPVPSIEKTKETA